MSYELFIRNANKTTSAFVRTRLCTPNQERSLDNSEVVDFSRKRSFIIKRKLTVTEIHPDHLGYFVFLRPGWQWFLFFNYMKYAGLWLVIGLSWSCYSTFPDQRPKTAATSSSCRKRDGTLVLVWIDLRMMSAYGTSHYAPCLSMNSTHRFILLNVDACRISNLQMPMDS